MRLTFCADAHAPGHLSLHLDDARQLARAAEDDSIAVLSRGTRSAVGIDET